MLCHILLIFFLIHILVRRKGTEGFQSNELINKNAKVLYKNKNLFKPHISYSEIKHKIPWIDPVIYNDMFSLSQKEEMYVGSIENVLRI
jgi:hypothetical protein